MNARYCPCLAVGSIGASIASDPVAQRDELHQSGRDAVLIELVEQSRGATLAVADVYTSDIIFKFAPGPQFRSM